MIEAYVSWPGGGKTLSVVRRCVRYRHIYTNIKLQNMPERCQVHYSRSCVQLVKDMVNVWQTTGLMARTVLAVDEAGINFPARQFQALPMELQWMFCEHRHMGIDFIYSTQTLKLVDSMLRGNTAIAYYCTHIWPLHQEDAYWGTDEKKKGKNGNFGWVGFYWGPAFYKYYDTHELVAGSEVYLARTLPGAAIGPAGGGNTAKAPVVPVCGGFVRVDSDGVPAIVAAGSTYAALDEKHVTVEGS
jgi:hypothetical protein